MDLKAIRDHLSLARIALGAEHRLSARIKTVERNLTPGDPLWVGEAIGAQTELLAIQTELEHLPGPMTADAPPDVNEAIMQIGDAIELL
jgi:hypothetical protein